MQEDRRLTVLAYADGLSECPECRVYFAPNRPWQKFCSDGHRQRAYERRSAKPLTEAELAARHERRRRQLAQARAVKAANQRLRS